VSDKCRISEVVLLEECFDIFGNGGVVVDFVVGRVTVVAGVDVVDRTAEGAG
jgi:hypothetical protein